MRKGWKNLTFESVLEIKNGKNQRAVESDKGQYPIYGSGGIMGYATDYLCDAGCTIIGRKGSINNPIFTPKRFWIVDTAFGLSPKAGLDAKFLHYFCLSYDFTMHNRGTTIPSLVKSELLQISMPIPPLAEQQRIVSILDEAFEKLATAKANAEKNLQNARALFESHLQSVFTRQTRLWVTKTFGEVLEIRNGRNQREVESATGEFPIYGSAGNVMGMATDYICEAGTTIIGRKGNINSPIYTETRF